MLIPVVDLTRECQYCWDGQWGRVRCGRLAKSFIVAIFNRHPQVSFRCDDHAGMNNDSKFPTRSAYPTIADYATFSLGYKP